MGFELPSLPYTSDALDPFIDQNTMELHHRQHHAGHLANLNAAVEGTPWDGRPVKDLLRKLHELPQDLQDVVRQHGGGHYNHCSFWLSMVPEKRKSLPDASLVAAITAVFGSLEEMKQAFAQAATQCFGSGWTWLCLGPDDSLVITSTANEDTPFMPQSHGGLGAGHRPLLALDVWEHAYYLKYQNRRAEYIAAWWNVVNWDLVGELFRKKRFLNLEDSG